jgi:hypothetical protein
VYCFCSWTVDSLNSLLTYGVFLLAWGFSGGTLLLYGSGTHGQRTQGFGHPGIKSLFCVLPFYYVSQYSLSVPNMETSTITIRLPIRHVKYYVRVFCSVYVRRCYPPSAASGQPLLWILPCSTVRVLHRFEYVNLMGNNSYRGAGLLGLLSSPVAGVGCLEAEGAGGCGGSEVRSSTSVEYYGTQKVQETGNSL